MPLRDGRFRRAFLKTIVVSTTTSIGGRHIIGTAEDSAGETEGRASGTAGTNQSPGSKEGPIPEGNSVGLRKVAGDLTAPVQYREPAGGPEHRFVADQTGVVEVLSPDGRRDDPFLDIRDELVALGEDLPEWAVNEERGLLGLAFHPNYGENRRFYVRYSAPKRNGAPSNVSHTEVLSEFRAGPDFRTADPDSERVMMEIPSPLPIHQAGAISFGPDGYLYVTMGDGGEPASAQNTADNLLGSVLRIDVDSEPSETTRNGGGGTTDADGGQNRPYSIPDDNPLVDGDGRDEFFAWGLRNPWRMSFNQGELYVADVGSALFEEVNVVENGGNYGWPVKEGPTCIELDNSVGQPTECPDETPAGVSLDSLRDPVIHYQHHSDQGVIGFAIVGGYVYQSDALPSLQGKYVFADYSSSYELPSGSLFVAEPSGEDNWQMTELTVANAPDGALDRTILSLGRGRDGELYVLTSGLPPSEAADFSSETGAVFKIVPPAQVETSIGEPNETS